MFDHKKWIAVAVAATLFAACSDDAPADTAAHDAGVTTPDADAARDAVDTTPDVSDADDSGSDAAADAADAADADAQLADVSDVSDGGDTIDAADTGDVTQPSYPDPLAGHWSDEFTIPGMSGGHRAQVSVLLAEEGTGKVYAGGNFMAAGTRTAKNVARWNGNHWEALGAGLDIHVHALALDGAGGVYAAGLAPLRVLTNELFHWDGTQWSVAGRVEPDDSTVHDMVRLANGEIIVAGDFQSIGGQSLSNLAKITSAGWQPVAAGMQPNGEVTDIEPTQTGFCIVGNFGSIGSVTAKNAACWDGSSWSALGQNLPPGPKTLLWLGGGEFLAGGDFTITDNTGQSARGLAKFDGTSWAPHAGGVAGGAGVEVRSLQKGASGEVYVAGRFDFLPTNGPGPSIGNIAKLRNGTWTTLDSGVREGLRAYGHADHGVYATALLDSGELLVGGFFSEASSEFAVNVARWDGAKWHRFVDPEKWNLGVAGGLRAMALGPDGELYAAGGMRFAGRLPVNNVAKLDNGRWHALAGGLTGGAKTLAVDGGTIYAGGSMHFIGPAAASFAAKWDGTNWWGLGAGVDGTINDMALGPNGTLYAVGDFDHVDGQDAGGVAYFDGIYWQTMGRGFNGPVEAVAVDENGTVYVGGEFAHTADAKPIDNLARWNGTEWVEVGGGTSGAVLDLAFYNGELAVVGSFQTAGGVTANSVAVWDGTSFRALANGVLPTIPNRTTSTVWAVAALPNGLFIGGDFDAIDTQPVGHLAWWDGQAWHALDGGVSDYVYELVVHDRALYVGGRFETAGDYPSYGIARWDF